MHRATLVVLILTEKDRRYNFGVSLVFRWSTYSPPFKK